MTIIGVLENAGFSRSDLQTSKPNKPGMTRSRMINSGFSSSAILNPSIPLSAWSTAYPSRSKPAATSRRKNSSSSTSRIFFFKTFIPPFYNNNLTAVEPYGDRKLMNYFLERQQRLRTGRAGTQRWMGFSFNNNNRIAISSIPAGKDRTSGGKRGHLLERIVGVLGR